MGMRFNNRSLRWHTESMGVFGSAVSTVAMAMAWYAIGISTTLANEVLRPNVIIILADDAGWGDYSQTGNKNLLTPAIDSLLRNGASLDRFYVQPVCSPTRAEILTGYWHPRGGVRGVTKGEERLDPSLTTIADDFRAAGYDTAYFGKWHNGSQWPYHPLARGFDRFYGFTSGHWGEYFNAPMEDNGVRVRGKGYIADDITDHLIDFISTEMRGDSPFLAHVSFNTPHSPMSVPDAHWELFRDRTIALTGHGDKEDIQHTRAALAMVENLDANVARVLDALRSHGILKNTIIVYLSDNGPNGNRWCGQMKGIKGSTDEGGVRSVCGICWPDQIAPLTIVREPTAAIDLLPTLAGLAGVPIKRDQPLDGIDLSAHCTQKSQRQSDAVGSKKVLHDRPIFSSFGGKTAVRQGPWMLDSAGDLFHLEKDPSQAKVLTTEEPLITSRLTLLREEWVQDVLSIASEEENRPFAVGYREFPWTPLPARDGIAKGGIKRSAPAPNCSYYTHWTSVDDTISWDISVQETGDYDLTLWYTVSHADAGATIEVVSSGHSQSGTVEPGWDPSLVTDQDRVLRKGESYMKDFRPLIFGTIRLEKGRRLLQVRATDIPGKSVMDLQQIDLVLRK